MLRKLLKYFLNGGYPFGKSNSTCGLLTNDDIQTFALYKQDSQNVGLDFEKTVQRAISEFGQVPTYTLYRGIGEKQTNQILSILKSGKKQIKFNAPQSFTYNSITADQFAMNGGGSMSDNNHGKGSLIMAKLNKKAFYLDEFEFYSILAENNWRSIVHSEDIENYTRNFNTDEVFEEVILEQEWLIPAEYVLHATHDTFDILTNFDDDRILYFEN